MTEYIKAVEDLQQRHLMMEECLEWHWFHDDVWEVIESEGKMHITEDGWDELDSISEYAFDRFYELAEELREV